MNTIILAIVGLLLGFTINGFGQEKENQVQMPLLVDKIENLVVDNGMMCLPQIQKQHNPNYIVLEAEDAHKTQFEEKIFKYPAILLFQKRLCGVADFRIVPCSKNAKNSLYRIQIIKEKPEEWGIIEQEMTILNI